MAIYHLHLKIITRGDGASAVGKAAYRSGQKLHSDYDGDDHDYTRKGGVVHTEILLPTNAPAEYSDRNTLWNAVEKIEKQCNSQLAREVEIALPVELSMEQNISLVRKYVQEQFVDKGMCADICVHVAKEENPHAHIMLTMRPLNDDKSWGAKIRKVGKKPVYTTDWNDRGKAEVWRAAWADAVNAELAAHGFTETVDYRSYERQGVEQIPTIHLGVSATQMERKGLATDRGDINREIIMTNSQMKQLRARINKMKVWVDEVKANTPPTLLEILDAILHPDANRPTGPDANRSNSKKIADLQLAATTFAFAQANNISDLPALADKVSAMRRTFNDVYDEIKKVERRSKTLDKHIEQCGNFKKYRGVKAEYDKLLAAAKAAEKETGFFAKGKADKARREAQDFYDVHDTEIIIFRAAEKYLKDVLQKRYNPKQITSQMKTWEQERGKKEYERRDLYAECHQLELDIKDAETIKRFAVKLIFPDEPQQQTRERSKGREQGR